MQSIWHYTLVGGCVLVAIVAMFISVLFMAFADSPQANLAARRAVVPTLIWTVLAEWLARGWINAPAGWWAYLLAFVAVASPPVVLIGLTFLLMPRKTRG